MAERTYWAGIDSGGDTSRLSVVDGELRPQLDVTLPSRDDAVVAALAPFARDEIREIAMEATATSIPLARPLRDLGFRVTIYEGRQVSRYLKVRRNKTDENDARGLAELARLQLPSMRAVHLKSPDVQRLRVKLKVRRKITIQRLQLENMMRAIFRLHGGKLSGSQSKLGLAANVSTALAEVRARAAIDLEPDIMPLLELATALRRTGTLLDEQFAAIARKIPACALFLSIPGVGPVCAISFYTAVEDPWRFKRPEDIGAYFGLTPRIQQSGSSLKHGRISKMGSSLTRAHLVNSATVIMRGNMDPIPLRTWALSLASRASAAKARVALARRLAVIMLAMWKNCTSFDETLPAARGAA